ncbi:MAG: pantoate--beta-alanine ligase [Flavobacteriales bacterium]
MIVCILNTEINSFLSAQNAEKSIGFVPTMGALHQGHLALIEKARSENELVVCSIFVNPTQFNDPKDFDRYPRNYEKDIQLLKSVGCDVLYLPQTEEVYKDESVLIFDFGGLDLMMEGLKRPGHFNGVVRVVKRLFEIVKPHKAYFGLKDYQQFLIVKKLAADFFPKLTVTGIETLREEDGLARSSRNELLSTKGKAYASSVYSTLNYCKTYYPVLPNAELKLKAIELLEGVDEVEYLEILSAEKLAEVDYNENLKVRAFIAVKIEGIRLIDNIALN